MRRPHRSAGWSGSTVLLRVEGLEDRTVLSPAGLLDTSFGSGGRVVTNFNGGEDQVNALAVQANGQLVAAGVAAAFNSTTNTDFAVARYGANGALDGTFGSGGKVTTDFGGQADVANAVAIQPDGKIVVAGQTFAGTASDIAVVRYNANGSLDTGFGSGGRVTFGFAPSVEVAESVVIQDDGKIVVAGRSNAGTTNFDFALLRLNPDGTPDSTFGGTQGFVTVDFNQGADAIHTLLLQPDDKLVAVGDATASGSIDFALARFNPDGTLDTTFGTGGKVTTDLGTSDDEAQAAVLLPSGAITAAGFSLPAVNNFDFALARYSATGQLDTTFGTGGTVTTAFGTGTSDQAFGLAAQPDGKVVAAGSSVTGTNADFALARYNTNGSLDATFGTAGKTTTNFPFTGANNVVVDTGSDVATSVLVQADGRIVAGGAATTTTATDFALARYQSDLGAGSIFEDTGPDKASIQDTVDAFRTALGGGTTPGSNGSFGGVRREINWDGVPDAKSAPNNLPANFFNTTSPRGVVFTTDGTGFQVSANATNPTNTPTDFGNLNPNYTTEFEPFSPQRLFTPLGNNVMEVNFFVPGSNIPGLVRGFGAVFSDVDLAGSSKIEFLDAAGNTLFSRDVLATPGNQTYSFLGVTFDSGTPIAKVRITSGNVAVGANANDSATNDVVVMDDFLYSEPQPVATPVHYFATGTDAGGGPNVLVFNAATGQVVFNYFSFDPRFTGGVRVAVGDVNADGVDDIISGAGPGGGPDIRVVDGKTGQQMAGALGQFFAYGQAFTGGVFVSSADVNGDGFDDIIVGADAGGGPNVTVFSGKDGSQLASFFPYDTRFTGGIRVAGGDFNNDGKADIVTGPGPGGGPNVSIINGADFKTLLTSYFAYGQAFTNGIYVATGDVNGDGKADVITGVGPGGGPNVSVFNGADFKLLSSFFPYDQAFTGGVRVAASDRNADGRADVLCVPGPGGGPDVRSVNALTGNQIDDFFAYSQSYFGGLFIGAH